MEWAAQCSNGLRHGGAIDWMNEPLSGTLAKLTAELQYLPDGIPFDVSGNDVFTSGNGNSELSAVLQFQLLL